MDINMDEFRHIANYPHYVINNSGVVINLKTRKFINGFIINHGYKMISLCNDDGKRNFLIHRLIYETFVRQIPDGLVIDHINNNRLDNRLENLQAVTQQQNCEKKIRNNAPRIARKIKAICLNYEETIIFQSMSSAERMLNICKMSIKYCCDGVTNSCVSRTTGLRYRFEYF